METRSMTAAKNKAKSDRAPSQSTSHSSSLATVRRLNAEARHAQALLKIRTEQAAQELAQQRALSELKERAANAALEAEIAEIDATPSSHRGSTHHVNRSHSWVHSLPDHFHGVPDPEGPRGTRSVPERDAARTGFTAVPPNVVASDLPGPRETQRGCEVNVACAGPLDEVPTPFNDIPQFIHTTEVPDSYGFVQNETMQLGNRIATQKQHNSDSDLKRLGDIILGLSATGNQRPTPPQILPFSGKATEWIAFKKNYDDTKRRYSPAENISRLRQLLRGEAARAVYSLLMTADDPELIIQALEERFAAPETIISEELATIRSLPRLHTDLKDLNTFASTIQNTVFTIKHLHQTQYLYSPELYNAILLKLTPLLRSLWTRYAASHCSSGTKLELLSEFLREEAQHHRRFGLLPQLSSFTYSDPAKKRVESCHAAVSFDSGSCGFCGDGHTLASCKKFQSIPVDDRREFVTKNLRCPRCLGNVRHRWLQCKFSKICGIDGCKYKHHKLLHGANVKNFKINPTCLVTEKEICCEQKVSASESVPSEPIQSVAQKHIENNSTYASCDFGSSQRKVLLKVVPVVVFGPSGSAETLALLDDGSTATIIDADLSKQLGLSGPKGHIRVQGVGGMNREDEIEYVDFQIRGAHQADVLQIKKARSIRDLDLSKQSVRFSDIAHYNHLYDIADLLTYEGKPSILIGAEDWHLTIAHEVRAGTRSQPVATRTLLGWVVHGCCDSKAKVVDFVNHVSTSEETATLDALDTLVREQFKLDALGVSNHPCSFGPLHERAIQILEETTRRLPNGRFETGLLWKYDHPEIPNSYEQALKRLKSLERKFSKDKDYAAAYRQNINAVIEKGYAEECTESYKDLVAKNTRFWYLPHFGVYHPQKKKLRVVHDAAAKSQDVSLNSLLLTGPDLLRSLLGILFRWREGRVALLADVKEMFPQIKIKESDRDMQRFLWREKSDEPIKEFRMSSMIFGAVSSPCTAIYLLNKNAEEHASRYPEASREVRKNTYMDDYVGSVCDVDQAAKLAADIVSLHKLAQFEMRGWVSNSPEALRLVPPDLHATPPAEVQVCTALDSTVRTLGLVWCPMSDLLSFRANSLSHPPSVYTKRTLLSDVMRLYDPLGVLSPVTIHGRILLQRAWRSNLGWDEPIPPDQCTQWKLWFDSLACVQSLKIPRWYFFPKFSSQTLELHVFADASESAYACVAYWRYIDVEGKVHMSLVASKARVTPNKPVSIPRLELQAALLACRLAVTIIKEHEIKPSRKHFWTDSKNVLGWIRTEARSLKTFVANRVGEIAENTEVLDWHWIPTHLNPADIATRTGDGIPSVWLDGPPFLFSDPKEWPEESSPKPIDDEGYLQEFKKDVVGAHVTIDVQHLVAKATRFSSWLRLVRATARAHQFIKILKLRRVRNSADFRSPTYHSLAPSQSSIPLNAEDLARAEEAILKQSQQETFPTELAALSKGSPLPRTSRLWKHTPFIDSRGIICLRGRIAAAEVPDHTKWPCVLDGRNHAARLLILHYHQKAAHGQPNLVANELRQRYWILHLRSSIKQIIRSCAKCTAMRSKPLCPPMGDLPGERLAHHRRPFTFVGLDYMGPVAITVGRRREKRYVALFTCLTSRAIHLEVVGSLSSESALMCLKRFISRRGTPTKVLSDNGTAFVGASNIIKSLREEGANLGIEWSFIPPAAPHMGGAWERLVGSVKNTLRAILKERAPREEVLYTALLEVEALVNSRPLTDLADNPSSSPALTPFHFILGSSSPYRPVPAELDDGDLLGRSDWRKSQRLADMFWGRWVKEYLPLLLPRRCPVRARNETLAVGDLVLVVDSSLPRGTWPRGRIATVFPGRDGVVRVAEVDTTAGRLRRPLTKLVKLPADAPLQQ